MQLMNGGEFLCHFCNPSLQILLSSQSHSSTIRRRRVYAIIVSVIIELQNMSPSRVLENKKFQLEDILSCI